jgi:hypothetical protein
MIFVLLSLTATLDALARNEIVETDLKTSLFSFQAGRSWVIDSTPHLLFAGQLELQSEVISLDLIYMLQKAIRLAESEGRVVWRRGLEISEVHRQLNAALTKVGLLPLNPDIALAAGGGYLKSAIERINNTRGTTTVRVIL